MSLETATYIDGLVETNPTGADSRTTADDHIRLTKASLKRTFSGVTGEVTATHTELNRTGGLSSSAQDQIDSLKDGKLNLSSTAVFSQSAGFATSATNATSAVFASSATNATSAHNARSAVYAYSATNATSAVQATNATNAGSAAYAYSAGRAASATRANSAMYARSAGDYNGSISAGQIPNSSVGGQGVAELGTTAEYAAGSDLTRIMSVGSLGRPRSKGANGYVTLPGGILFQWGVANNVANGATISFPRSFSGSPYSVTITWRGTASGGEDTVGVTSTSTSNFTISHSDMGGSAADWYWMAIGPV